MSVSWLDVKLGLRMLIKYPGLSLVAVTGMALTIAIGAGSFGAIYAMVDPTLPLDEGDRVVTIQNNRADNPGNPDRGPHSSWCSGCDGSSSWVRLLNNGDGTFPARNNPTYGTVAPRSPCR